MDAMEMVSDTLSLQASKLIKAVKIQLSTNASVNKRYFGEN